jgi:hypothetical protein
VCPFCNRLRSGHNMTQHFYLVHNKANYVHPTPLLTEVIICMTSLWYLNSLCHYGSEHSWQVKVMGVILMTSVFVGFFKIAWRKEGSKGRCDCRYYANVRYYTFSLWPILTCTIDGRYQTVVPLLVW